MFNVGPAELLIIALVLLIAVGPEQLPGVIRRAGSTVAQFRSMTDGLRSEFMAGLDEIERATDVERWAADSEDEARSTNGTEPASDSDSSTAADDDTETASETETETDPETETETDPEVEPESEAGVDDGTTADDGSDGDADPMSDRGADAGNDREPNGRASDDRPDAADDGPAGADQAETEDPPVADRALKPSWGKQEGDPV